jgi:Ca2+-binding RTX toxin-like protein
MDYCVMVTMHDGSAQAIFGQKSILVDANGDALFTLTTWTDFSDPQIVSINMVHLFVENDASFSYALKGVTGQEHLYEEFDYVIQDGDGDQDSATLHLQASAANTTFNTQTIYDGNSRTDPGNGVEVGGAGDDLILGWTDSESLCGNGGNDTIAGWSGDDTLYGGAGNDVLLGEVGSDILWGETGADIFVASRGDLGNADFDTVEDFSTAQGDVIDLSSVIDGFNNNSDIGDFVRAVNSNGSTMLQVNTDGQGNDWEDVMLINNQSSTGLDMQQYVEDLFQSGNLDVT